MNISAKNTSETPPAVRLAQGEVQWNLCNTFMSLRKQLENDTLLDKSRDILGLLVTVFHIGKRFEQFNRLPSAIAKLSRR